MESGSDNQIFNLTLSPVMNLSDDLSDVLRFIDSLILFTDNLFEGYKITYLLPLEKDLNDALLRFQSAEKHGLVYIQAIANIDISCYNIHLTKFGAETLVAFRSLEKL